MIFIPICGGKHSCSNEDDVLEIHTNYGGDRCSVCGGDGKLDEYVCSSHNNVNLTSESQNHCAHGKTSQHD